MPSLVCRAQETAGPTPKRGSGDEMAMGGLPVCAYRRAVRARSLQRQKARWNGRQPLLRLVSHLSCGSLGETESVWVESENSAPFMAVGDVHQALSSGGSEGFGSRKPIAQTSLLKRSPRGRPGPDRGPGEHVPQPQQGPHVCAGPTGHPCSSGRGHAGPSILL